LPAKCRDSSQTTSPHPQDHLTKIKLILPVGKKKAWRLIATTRGIASWFPTQCKDRVRKGHILEFIWSNGRSEHFKVLYAGKLRYYLHGRLTTLTLEVDYPNKPGASSNQISEIALWIFLLAHLKSVALKGQDLRNRMTSRSWSKGLIDSGEFVQTRPLQQ